MAQQESPPPGYPPPEDEIDLADLAAVLYRRRWLIVGGTVLVTLLALIYTLLLPARYEVKSFLAVGKANGGLIAKPDAVASQMTSFAQALAERRNQGDQELGFSAEGHFAANAKGGGIIRVSISEAPKRETTTRFMDRVAQYVVEDHAQEIERQRQSLKQEIQTVKAEIADLEERKKKLDGRVENLTGSQSPEDASLSVLTSILKGVRADLESHKLKLDKLETELASIRPTEVMLEPTYSKGPVTPNLRLNVALGLVLGGFLSVFAAFLWEFWVNNRDRIRGEAE